jgi:glycosyltransferase involved in cell wall biosynthesis
MKIVHIISSLGNGGAERLVIDLTNELVKGNEVVLCTLKDNNGTMLYLGDLDQRVKVISFGKKKGLNLKLSLVIFRFLQKEKPQIVNSHLSSAATYLILSQIILRRICFFHTIHSLPKIEEPRVFFRIIRRFLIRSKRLQIIAVSDEIGKQFFDLYNLYVSDVIYNGRSEIRGTSIISQVSNEIISIKPNSETKVFVSVGRLSEEKNQSLLVRVFKKLYSLKINAILIIIGDDYGIGLKEKLEREKASNTFLLGSKKNIGDYLLNSDYFCLSSLYEGLPITILEALNLGMPIISTRVGGIPDVLIDGTNGFLSSGDDEEYLKAIMRCILTDKKEMEIIKARNRNLFYMRFSIKLTANNYIRLYSKHLNFKISNKTKEAR